MTNDNAALANDTGLPALLAHIDDMQTLSFQADELMRVVLHLENEGACEGGRQLLSEMIAEKIKRINSGLDCVNLPKVAT